VLKEEFDHVEGLGRTFIDPTIRLRGDRERRRQRSMRFGMTG
jgi:hypothetical protein